MPVFVVFDSFDILRRPLLVDLAGIQPGVSVLNELLTLELFPGVSEPCNCFQCEALLIICELPVLTECINTDDELLLFREEWRRLDLLPFLWLWIPSTTSFESLLLLLLLLFLPFLLLFLLSLNQFGNLNPVSKCGIDGALRETGFVNQWDRHERAQSWDLPVVDFGLSDDFWDELVFGSLQDILSLLSIFFFVTSGGACLGLLFVTVFE